MPERHDPHHTEDMHDYLLQVQRLLEKQAFSEPGPQGQESAQIERQDLLDKMVHKRHLKELHKKLAELHPSDIAYILKALPIAQRLTVWNLVEADRDGEILIKASNAVRVSLIATMGREELRKATQQLNSDEIADLAPYLPHNVMSDVFRTLAIEEREQLRTAMSYSENSVGAWMDFNMVQVREDVTLKVVSRYLRRFDALPEHTDQVFVVDRDDRFKGVLPTNLIVLNKPETTVGQLMLTDTLRLNPDDAAHQATQSFQRYGLVSAPVVDEYNKLVGRVTVNAVLDFLRSESETGLLKQAGLRTEEDIFASVWKSARNRWGWLVLNLCAAFLASRVIGVFENSIEKIVALAALLPIFAGIAGNGANQTTTVFVRSIASGQITHANARLLMLKELAISGLNGLVWGGAAGLFAFFLYHSIPLGIVMTSAMLLSLILGAASGLAVPLMLHKLGREPSIGSGVLISAITNCGGFFIFLGLATIFLVR